MDGDDEGRRREQRHRQVRVVDEVEPLQDARVRANEAYLGILLLSRVITRLGDMRQISPAIVEGLFSADMSYLQNLYIQVNDAGTSIVETECPSCGTRFALDLAGEASDE